MPLGRTALLFPALALCLATVAPAAPVLHAIALDSSGIPRAFDTIDAVTGAAAPVALLGDGSLGFTGGLAFDAATGRFFAVAGDAFGNSSLQSFAPDGSGLVEEQNLGSGFLGGLTFAGADLFALSQDLSGSSILNRITPGGVTSVLALGNRFTGGLAWDPREAVFYGIANDQTGNSSLFRIDPDAGTVAAAGPSLGTGFLGGLAFDPDANIFYALGSDTAGFSSLYRFAFADSAPSLVGRTGFGYVNAGLTLLPEVAAVPEPATGFLIGVAFLALGARRRF